MKKLIVQYTMESLELKRTLNATIVAAKKMGVNITKSEIMWGVTKCQKNKTHVCSFGERIGVVYTGRRLEFRLVKPYDLIKISIIE